MFLKLVDLFPETRYNRRMANNKGLNMYFDQRHGGPYDRGTCDSYYRRDYNPHYFVGDSYNTPRIELAQMSAAETMEYTAGFRDNEACNNFKDLGEFA